MTVQLLRKSVRDVTLATPDKNASFPTSVQLYSQYH